MKNVTLQTRSLFISAGHSDTDPGATGNGFTEADVVLEFRDMLGDALRRRGIVFDKDGTPGCNLPLRDAVGAAKTHDIAVEFHCNAFSNPAASGVETLSERQHYSLGESICNAIAGVLGINNRGAKGEDSGQHSRLAFIRDGGGVIVELFFITNKSDLSTYLANKHRVVDAVADVLTDAAMQERDV